MMLQKKVKFNYMKKLIMTDLNTLVCICAIGIFSSIGAFVWHDGTKYPVTCWAITGITCLIGLLAIRFHQSMNCVEHNFSASLGCFKESSKNNENAIVGLKMRIDNLECTTKNLEETLGDSKKEVRSLVNETRQNNERVHMQLSYYKGTIDNMKDELISKAKCFLGLKESPVTPVESKKRTPTRALPK